MHGIIQALTKFVALSVNEKQRHYKYKAQKSE